MEYVGVRLDRGLQYKTQQSTGVALFEVLAPEKVRKFALARLPESQYPKECKETA